MDRPRTREAGFTIVEVLVAIFILVIGALATFGLLTDAIRNTQRAKATQVALDRAQQEIETLRGLPYQQLAMTATPVAVTNPLSPNYRVSGGTFAVVREPPSSYYSMVVSAVEGKVSPGPEPFSSGDVSGKIYRYVVWRKDERCGAACSGEQNFKQVVIAVKLDKRSNEPAERGYVEVQSDFVDPARGL